MDLELLPPSAHWFFRVLAVLTPSLLIRLHNMYTHCLGAITLFCVHRPLTFPSSARTLRLGKNARNGEFLRAIRSWYPPDLKKERNGMPHNRTIFLRNFLLKHSCLELMLWEVRAAHLFYELRATWEIFARFLPDFCQICTLKQIVLIDFLETWQLCRTW